MASGAQSQITSSDEELALHFGITGDNECFSQLFASHRKRVFFVCRSFFDDGSAAEDATQETFLRAYENIAQFHGGDFSRWIMRIAKNVCIATAKLRWRIERDYEELKQELGLGHFEGRNWRGFHHHASLCIAAYGFLVMERWLFSPTLHANDIELCLPRLLHSTKPRGTADSNRTA
jgi:RNA polymerase sigma factor (sigma-70 family)